jgi:neurocan core protein
MRKARWAGALALTVGLLLGMPAGAGAAKNGPPSPPRSLRTTPGDARATVRWHAPDHLNGAPVRRWRVTAYGPGDNPLPTRESASSQTAYVYPGLQNGRLYTFTVAAKNKYGWSGLSARSDPVEIGVPLPPGKPAAKAGVGRATVSWHTPTSNGATVKAYRVTPFIDDHLTAARTFTSMATTQVITGLKHGRRYTFTVAAHNNRGWSKPSNPSAAIIVK